VIRPDFHFCRLHLHRTPAEELSLVSHEPVAGQSRLSSDHVHHAQEVNLRAEACLRLQHHRPTSDHQGVETSNVWTGVPGRRCHEIRTHFARGESPLFMRV